MKTEDFPVFFRIKKDGELLDGYKTAEEVAAHITESRKEKAAKAQKERTA